MFRPSMITRTLAVGLLTIGLAAGTACSSDGSDSNAKETATTLDGSGENDRSTTTTTLEGDAPPDATTPGATDDAQDYVDRLAEVTSGSSVATVAQGTCLGEAWVDVIGFDAIVDADLSPDQFANLDPTGYQHLELDDAQGNELFAAFDTCDIDVVGSIRKSFADGATPQQQACISDKLTEDVVRDLFIQNLLGGTDPADGRMEALQGCFSQ